MQRFYGNDISGGKNPETRGSKISCFSQPSNNMNSNFRFQQMAKSGVLRRSQQISPEFSEPFDLDSEYIQREAPAPFRYSKNQDDFKKRPYSRSNESIIPRQSPGQGMFQSQTMSLLYLPTFEPKYQYEASKSQYAIGNKENFQNNGTTTEFNIDKKNTFVATNKNDEIKKNLATISMQPKNMKMSSSKRRCYFIGSIEQVTRWFRIAKQVNVSAIYEISATLESVQQGKTAYKHVLFLRSEGVFNSSVLQAVFFGIDRNLPKLQTGQSVTCVGRMIGANKLQVLDIWHNTLEEQAGIKRISFLCQRTLQEASHASSHSQ